MEDFLSTDQDFLEKELVEIFLDKCLEKFRIHLNAEELRIYCFEFPVEYSGQKGKIDLILEIVKDGNIYNRENPLLVIEFKKNKIKYGPVDQLNFYMKDVGKRLYRENVRGYLAAPDFSYHELEEARKNDFGCIRFDTKGNIDIMELK